MATRTQTPMSDHVCRAMAVFGALLDRANTAASRLREGPSELGERVARLTALGQIDWQGDRPYIHALRRGDLIVSDGRVRMVRAVRPAGALPARMTHADGSMTRYQQEFSLIVLDRGESQIRAANTLVRRVHVRPASTSARFEPEPGPVQRFAQRVARGLRKRNAAFVPA